MMNKVKLANAVIDEKVVKVEVRPDLYALKCESCGFVFNMLPFNNDSQLAELSGIFDKCSPKDGNIFRATVCSFYCAHDIFHHEKWKELDRYFEFLTLDAKLIRVSLTLTGYIENETELRNRWEKIKNERYVTK